MTARRNETPAPAKTPEEIAEAKHAREARRQIRQVVTLLRAAEGSLATARAAAANGDAYAFADAMGTARTVLASASALGPREVPAGAEPTLVKDVPVF